MSKFVYNWILAQHLDRDIIGAKVDGLDIIPWKSKEDMFNYRRLTKDSSVIVLTYNTFKSIINRGTKDTWLPKIFDGRKYIVFSQTERQTIADNYYGKDWVYLKYRGVDCIDQVKALSALLLQADITKPALIAGGPFLWRLFNQPETIFLTTITSKLIQAENYISFNFSDFILDHEYYHDVTKFLNETDFITTIRRRNK